MFNQELHQTRMQRHFELLNEKKSPGRLVVYEHETDEDLEEHYNRVVKEVTDRYGTKHAIVRCTGEGSYAYREAIHGDVEKQFNTLIEEENKQVPDISEEDKERAIILIKRIDTLFSRWPELEQHRLRGYYGQLDGPVIIGFRRYPESFGRFIGEYEICS